MNDVQAVLAAAREKIRDPKNWTKHYTRYEVRSNHYAYCALGALAYSCPDAEVGGEPIFAEAEKRLQECLPAGVMSIVAFNDFTSTSHEDILHLFDCALREDTP